MGATPIDQANREFSPGRENNPWPHPVARTDYLGDRNDLYKVETAIVSGSLGTTAGTEIIVQGCSGAAGQICRILSWHIGATLESNPFFASTTNDTGATPISGPIWLSANAIPSHGPYSPVGHFDTLSGEGLVLRQSDVMGGGGIGGYVRFVKI